MKKLRGAAIGKKIVPNESGDGDTQTDLSRKFVFRGIRPEVAHRRTTPPVFIPNYDVPAEVMNAIRNGDDILAMLPHLPEKLSPKNYQSKMTALLYCEEVAQSIQIAQYILKGVQFEHLHNSLYTIDIPGIKSDSPKLLEADRLIIHLPGENLVEYHAFVHGIMEGTKVIVEMHENFCAKYLGGDATVEFSLNRYPIRNEHAAVKKFGTLIRAGTLFPTLHNFVREDRRRFRWSHPFNEAVKMISGLNQCQADAVRQVLEGGGLCHPMIIFGPAGTGKTRTLVELTRILMRVSTDRDVKRFFYAAFKFYF